MANKPSGVDLLVSVKNYTASFQSSSKYIERYKAMTGGTEWDFHMTLRFMERVAYFCTLYLSEERGWELFQSLSIPAWDKSRREADAKRNKNMELIWPRMVDLAIVPRNMTNLLAIVATIQPDLVDSGHAEVWIRQGMVEINGKPVEDPFQQFKPTTDMRIDCGPRNCYILALD